MSSEGPIAPKVLDELVTLAPGRPLEARQRLVEAIRAHTPFDIVVGFSPRVLAGGALAYAAFAVTGHPAFRSFAAEWLEGAPVLQTPTLDLRRPNRGERSRFVVVENDRDRDGDSEVQTKVFEPFGVRSLGRAILYSGDTCVGWLGVLRGCDEPAPSDEELRALDTLVDPVTAVFHATMAGSDAEFAVYGPGGGLEWATPNAAPVVADPHVAARLGHAVRRLDRGDIAYLRVDLGVRSVRLVRMDGHGVRYHAHFANPALPRIAPDAELTSIQRQVASYAVAGATNREIAEVMGISPETVKDHLKAIYQRLHVGSRVELANALNGHGR